MFTSVQQSSESTAKRKLSNQVCRSCIDDDDDDVYHPSAFVLCIFDLCGAMYIVNFLGYIFFFTF